jgi:hypothetical protein
MVNAVAIHNARLYEWAQIYAAERQALLKKLDGTTEKNSQPPRSRFQIKTIPEAIRSLFRALSSNRFGSGSDRLGWCARGGLELPTFWFVAMEAGNLSALRGVAYGRFGFFSCSSVVCMLYANFPMRSTLIPISQAFRDDSPASGERAIAADRDRFADRSGERRKAVQETNSDTK